ncbi:uncharacterized protein FA14DRAFT_59301 [Meira miltonrushii]|uniref:Uncharacterized protein n=1 Tax=Meira miltonrushii TaxID=1280837 RepID=A0A316V6H6_9BASI|nr:uncharacterized protein FA14DRAFT_59301 [Meira miltonrushii]PWN33199.1 hypothetical protein FA14DRAFT_59301 [Meira miltonrushii]
MQITSFSAIASVATVLAMMTGQAKAAPTERPCSQADQYGNFNVTAPSTVATGDKLKVTYELNCSSLIVPRTLTFNIGKEYNNLETVTPFVQVVGPKSLPYGKEGVLAEYTTTLPNFDLTGFYQGNELVFLGTIVYTERSQDGNETDYIYTMEQPFTYDRPSN